MRYESLSLLAREEGLEKALKMTLLNDPILSASDSHLRVWSVRDGKFSGQIRHRLGEQLQRWVERCFTGWREMLQNEGADGRINWINDDSFQLTWVNPQTHVDGLTVIMTREGSLTTPPVDDSPVPLVPSPP